MGIHCDIATFLYTDCPDAIFLFTRGLAVDLR